MRLTVLTGIGLLLLTAGCVSAAVWTLRTQKQTTVIDFPETGIIVSGGLGDTLVAKGLVTTEPGIIVKEAGCVAGCDGGPLGGNCDHRLFEAGQTAALFAVIPADKRALPSKGEAECFMLTMKWPQTWNCGGPEHTWPVCRAEGQYFSPAGLNRDELPIIGGSFIHTEIVNAALPAFKQEFIYNGRYENNLKFVYREYVNDIARPAFTQEVQYDLSQQNIIGFKSLKMEVLKATNTSIEFRLISNFDGAR